LRAFFLHTPALHALRLRVCIVFCFSRHTTTAVTHVRLVHFLWLRFTTHRWIFTHLHTFSPHSVGSRFTVGSHVHRVCGSRLPALTFYVLFGLRSFTVYTHHCTHHLCGLPTTVHTFAVCTFTFHAVCTFRFAVQFTHFTRCAFALPHISHTHTRFTHTSRGFTPALHFTFSTVLVYLWFGSA